MELLRPWRQAARSLCRRPAYAFTAVLILAFGIGAVAALWAVVDTVLLKPLPYPGAGRLVYVLESNPARHENASLIAPARLEDWNRGSEAFVAIAGLYDDSVTDTSGPEPQRYSAVRVSARYFEVFGTPALVGRTFTPAEERPALGGAGPPAAVISYGLWTARYARSRSAVGSRLVFGGVGYTVVGVMPRTFASPGVDLWLPADVSPALLQMREARFYSGVGRLRPGVTLAAARADLDRLQRRLGREYPATDAGWSASVRDLKQVRTGDDRDPLWSVFTALVLLFLIAVANIAGLTLTQLHRRQRELAIRAAIGGARARVVAALMREVLLLALVGALGGAVLAAAAIRALAAHAGALPRMAELGFDWRAWSVAALAATLAAAGFGLLPALLATRLRLAPLMAGAGADASRHRLQRGLAVAQLAVTVTLLAAAGLLLRSYRNLDRVQPGFDAAHVYTFHVGAGWSEQRNPVGDMQVRLLAGLRALPGAVDAGYANFLPVNGATLRFQLRMSGVVAHAGAGGLVVAGERTISSGYLQTLAVPLLAGAWCPATHTDLTRPGDVLVNRSFAQAFGGSQSLVGRDLRFVQDGAAAPAQHIVGVVGDVREDGLASAPVPFIYDCLSAGAWPDPDYVVRTRASAAAFAASLRDLVAQVAPGRAIYGLHPLSGDIDAALEQPRLDLRFLSLFAGLAMLLAAVGLYSLISLLVLGRTRELGVRLALGASPRAVLLLVAAAAARLALAGIAAGVLLSLPVLRLLQSMLYGVQPLDAVSLAAALLVLVAVSALAVWIPARRAAAIDPWTALRQQ